MVDHLQQIFLEAFEYAMRRIGTVQAAIVGHTEFQTPAKHYALNLQYLVSLQSIAAEATHRFGREGEEIIGWDIEAAQIIETDFRRWDRHKFFFQISCC